MTYGKHQIEFFKNSGYLQEGETLEERIEDIVRVVRTYEHQYMEGLSEIIKEMLYKRELSPSTPQWSNLGRKKVEGSNSQALPASCNIVSVGDSIADIYGAYGEIAMLSKLGAGVGVNWINVSETGTKLGHNFYSNNKLDWVEDGVRVSQKVSQGVRRGYSVPFISIMDKSFYDIMKRADKTNPNPHDPLVDNNIGIILPPGFMEDMKTNKEAQKRFILVMQQRKMKGKIYLMDMDNSNKNTSPVYGKLGQVVDSTNICCVSGDTKILTDKGHQEIGPLEGKKVNVWNGEEYSKVLVEDTGKNRELWRVEFSNQMHIDATDNHKFFIEGKGKISTMELEVGDKVEPYLLPSYPSRMSNVRVESISKLEGLHDTFCFNEPKLGKGVFNGVLTGQSEVLTPSYDDKTFVCVLASLNLQFWDELKANPQKIKAAFMFLDICVSEYIRLTEGIPFMEKSRRSALEKRDLGLGTLGYHDLLQSKGFAFGDMGSRMLNKEIYKTIREIGEEYTKEIGEKIGSPKMCQEAGMTRRNVSLMMVAPNKSTSFTAGETSMGIEPFMSNYFVHDLSAIHKVFKNPHLEKLLEDKEMNTVDVWNDISKHQGSVQHLDFLSGEEKEVFKTATEISPKDMIDLAADRQKYIDMGQSFNLFDRPGYTIQDVYDIHKYGIEKGIKTFYYYYPSGHASISRDSGESWDSCVACAD